jgi:hypothetical protein
VCEPECPADAIRPDTEPDMETWVEFNRKYSVAWPVIVTRIINNRLPPEQRVAVIEMLWQVVYADGSVDDYESNLVRRVAGLLHVSDRDAGEARKRAIAGQKE